MKKLAVLLTVLMTGMLMAQTQPGPSSYTKIFNPMITTGQARQVVDLRDTTAYYHSINYFVRGTASVVGLVVAGSPDCATFSTITTLSSTTGTNYAFSGSYCMVAVSATWTASTDIELYSSYSGSATVSAKITGGGTSGQVAVFDGLGSIAGSATLTHSTTTGTTMTKPLTNTQGTLTDSAPAYSHTVTWNDAAEAFDDDIRTITSTGSASGSTFVRYNVGATNQVCIRKDGSISKNQACTFSASGIQLLAADSVIVGGGGAIQFNSAANTGGLIVMQPNGNMAGVASATYPGARFTHTVAPGAGSGSFNIMDSRYTINASGVQTGTVTGLKIIATETALNSFTHNLVDLQAGSSPATVLSVSNAGRVNPALYGSLTNCSDSAGAAACSAAPVGVVVIDAGATTVVVSTTAVTANSRIFIQEDPSLATALGITCNTTVVRTYAVTARTAATSFTVTTSAAPAVDPACINYWVVN